MEISLSIEETNKLRKKLGLREILQLPQHDSFWLSVRDCLLVAETNKLRASAGLKPIPDEVASEEATVLSSSISNEQLIAKLRTRKIEKHVEEDDTVTNTDDWLNNLGKVKHSPNESEIVENNEETAEISTPEPQQRSTEAPTSPAETEEVESRKRNIGSFFADMEEDSQPVKIKKMKKKSLKSRKKHIVPDNEPVEIKPVVLEKFDDGDDDAEVQLMMNNRRKAKLHQRKKLLAEELERELSQMELQDAHEALHQPEGLSTGLVFDDTADFLDSLNQPEPTKKVGNNAEKEEASTETIESNETSITSGPRFNSGVGSTLNYLRQQAVVQTDQKSQSEARERREAAKKAELTKLAIEIESRSVREQLEEDSSYTTLPKEERETIFERYLDERLKEKGLLPSPTGRKPKYEKYNKDSQYRPQVQLVYKDKDGRELLQKQAFKHLSHQFHGAKSGKPQVHKPNPKKLPQVIERIV